MKLIIENVSKSFGDKEVLKGVNYTFEQGFIYALLGRNGSGKTTLFSLISEQIKKDSGKVYLEENGLKKEIDFKDVFMMIAEPELPNFLTGREFIKFFIDANRNRISNLKTIDEYFNILDFNLDDADRLIQAYSTGMKNKLQMLMFLILRPKVILMDEPLTSLDVVVQLEVKKIIKSIQNDHIIIFSTHILQLAKDICDDIVLINNKTLIKLDDKVKNDKDFEDNIIKLLSQENEDLSPISMPNNQ